MNELAVFAGVVGGMLDGLLFRGEPAFDEKGRKTAPTPKADSGISAADLFRKQYPGTNPDYIYTIIRRPLLPIEGVAGTIEEITSTSPEVKPIKARKNPRRPKYAYQILTRAIEALKRDERFKCNRGVCWTVLGILATESLNLDSEMKVSTGSDYNRILEVLKPIKNLNTGEPITVEEALSILNKVRRMVR